MEITKAESIGKKMFNRYCIQALNGMALGLFCTLIIGLIINQFSSLFSENIEMYLHQIAVVAMALTGPVIGIGIATSLKQPRLVVLACAVLGFIGANGTGFANGEMLNESGKLVLKGAGDPLGAYITVVIGGEIGKLVSGKTKVDIIITPLVTILAGSIVAFIFAPPLYIGMKSLGSLIDASTQLQPLLMGCVVAVLMGMALTLPISSAALSIILGLSGLAAGAATIGCSAQMVGFAIISYKANGMNGLLAQGLGTSMLQVPNIMKKPVIWLPPIIASFILGPISTVILQMQNNSAGGGMGTSGLVGQLMTWQTMQSSTNNVKLFIMIVMMHFILPGILSFVVYKIMEMKHIITFEDYKLHL